MNSFSFITSDPPSEAHLSHTGHLRLCAEDDEEDDDEEEEEDDDREGEWIRSRQREQKEWRQGRVETGGVKVRRH